MGDRRWLVVIRFPGSTRDVFTRGDWLCTEGRAKRYSTQAKAAEAAGRLQPNCPGALIRVTPTDAEEAPQLPLAAFA